MKTIYVLGTIQNMTKMCVSQKIESISEKANFLEKKWKILNKLLSDQKLISVKNLA